MSKPRKKIRPQRREIQCGSKQAYATEDEASNAAYRPRGMLIRGGFMAAYRCRFCKLWHYGHPMTK